MRAASGFLPSVCTVCNSTPLEDSRTAALLSFATAVPRIAVSVTHVSIVLSMRLLQFFSRTFHFLRLLLGVLQEIPGQEVGLHDAYFARACSSRDRLQHEQTGGDDVGALRGEAVQPLPLLHI